MQPVQPEEMNSAELQKLEEQRQHKQNFVRKLKSAAPNASSSVDQQMDALLQQAEYYANYLLSHHE